MKPILFLSGIFWFTLRFLPTNGLVELSNLKCTSIDKAFADFEYCYIKSINRSYKYVSLKVNLFQVPVHKVSVQVQTMKKASGYRLGLYNITFDACKFLRLQNNVLINYFFSFIEKHSNMNHTCPFDHDLIVDKVDVNFLNNQVTKILPVPEGEYAVFTTWMAYNVPRAHVNIYGRIKYTSS